MEAVKKLFGSVAEKIQDQVTIEHLWCGRNVKVIDGSTVSMPDTVENQFVIWHKPKKCPNQLREEEFVALPETLIVREIYYYILIPGFRTSSVSLITTLLDTETYPTLELVRLYEDRWDNDYSD